MQGWCITSYDLIFKTLDGGKTWEKPSLQIPEMEDGYDIHFLNNLEGWAVGKQDAPASGVIVRTFDGGETWLNPVYTDENLYSVYFIDKNTGWIAGYHNIWRYAPLAE